MRSEAIDAAHLEREQLKKEASAVKQAAKLKRLKAKTGEQLSGSWYDPQLTMLCVQRLCQETRVCCPAWTPAETTVLHPPSQGVTVTSFRTNMPCCRFELTVAIEFIEIAYFFLSFQAAAGTALQTHASEHDAAEPMSYDVAFSTDSLQRRMDLFTDYTATSKFGSGV